MLRNINLVLLAFFASANVNAAPVEWTIDSLVFDDGGSGSGSFTYDADTNFYSNIDIVTTSGTSFGGAAYDVVNDFAPNSSDFLVAIIVPFSGAPALQLGFATQLTNVGGVVTIDYAVESQCGDGCEIPVSDYRSISSGQISAVPVPAAVWLFGSALAGLGWLRRKQVV